MRWYPSGDGGSGSRAVEDLLAAFWPSGGLVLQVQLDFAVDLSGFGYSGDARMALEHAYDGDDRRWGASIEEL